MNKPRLPRDPDDYADTADTPEMVGRPAEGAKSNAPQKLYVVLKCYGYEPGSVSACGAYLSREKAEAETRQAEDRSLATSRDGVRDGFWVEEVELDGELAIARQLTALQDAVKAVKTGECWCQFGIGNPMYGGHTTSCGRLRALVDPSSQEQP